MATKEAKTTDEVKQALVNTPGIEEGWVGRLKSDGGMTSGQSHLLADLYEIDNDFARASRLITSLDPDTYADHASEIIEAIRMPRSSARTEKRPQTRRGLMKPSSSSKVR